MTNQTHQIRTLNDDLRRHLSRTSELAFMTPGIAALGPEAVDRAAAIGGRFRPDPPRGGRDSAARMSVAADSPYRKETL